MRIAYVCAYSEIASGGDSRVAWELARYMAGYTNNEIWMICPGRDFSIQKDAIEQRLHIQTVPSVDCIEGVSLFSPTFSNVATLYYVLDNLKPDIIHSHNFDPCSFAIQGWAISRNTNFVYTGHLLATSINEWQDFNLGKALESIISISLVAYTRRFYKNCSRIICLNDFAKEDYVKFTKEPSKMVVIPNGHKFNYSKSKCKSLENSNEYNLLFAGYINERKNQKFLIEMLKFLKTEKKVNLLLAGTFMTKEYENVIKKGIRNLPKNRSVKILGFVEHNELLEMFDKVHYVVSAALAEVQSLFIIESLAAGTPVIGLENTTILELVKNGYNGIILRKDTRPEDYANIVSEYLDNSDKEYKRMCKNSVDSVRFLDYENISNRYNNFYKELVKEGSLLEEKNFFSSMGRIFKWDFSDLRFNGKKLSYDIAFGLISAVIVSGTSIVNIYNNSKERKSKN